VRLPDIWWNAVPGARIWLRNRLRSAAVRPSTLDAYAREAGFARADVLPLEHGFFRFYELVLTA
jgi:hypothetical protein